MSDEENFSTTLAYTKSPKVSRRTKFQDELHRAVATRVAKQTSVEENYFSDLDDFDLSDSGTNSKSSEKKLPTLKELVQDNNEENTMDEMNTKKTETFSQKGAAADSWQTSYFKPNQCMVQCATDHVTREPLQKNSLKPKAKDQAKMIQNEGKIQKAEAFRKSLSKRHSLIQTLERSAIGKSPRPRTTESRYLGTLKILDTKSSNNAFNLETADTIRASIYQVNSNT